jgi:uncharacterized protein (DUF39 family)
MDDRGKEVSVINRKIAAGEAVVLTERELRTAAGDDGSGMPEADVVVVACRADISGTSAMMVVPVAERGVFTRAQKIWLNGVPGFPGPAPNERLGVVDTLVFADQQGKDGDYHGADLLADVIGGKEIAVECLSVEGNTYHGSFTMDRLQFARMYVYNSFLPAPATDAISRTIGVGSRILLNGAEGIVVGRGTRSSAQKRSLSLSAEMYRMDTPLVEATGPGVRAWNTVALAVPVVSEAVLRSLLAWSRDRQGGPETDAADRLKGLIDRREFLLTVTDMGLGG